MTLFIVLIIGTLSTLLGGCSIIDESQFPITNPQYVIGTTSGSISIDTIKVNEEEWNLSTASITVEPGGPKKNLAGANGIGIDVKIKNNVETRTLRFGVSLPKEYNQEKMPISGMGITYRPTDKVTDIQKRDSLTSYSLALSVECPKGNGYYYKGETDLPDVKLIPNGPFVFEQRTKYLKLKGVFDVPSMIVPRDPYMICDSKIDEKGFLQPASPLYRNPAPPAIIEIKGIHIDIDTELIFKWCNKGGKCYQK